MVRNDVRGIPPSNGPRVAAMRIAVDVPAGRAVPFHEALDVRGAGSLEHLLQNPSRQQALRLAGSWFSTWPSEEPENSLPAPLA